MRRALDLLRTGSAARTASISFLFLVSWIAGAQASTGMSGDQWMAAAAAVAGALTVVLLVHGPAVALGRRRPGRLP